MNVGMITCTYYMKIYNYQTPDPFNWGKMSQKWRDEFSYDDFLYVTDRNNRADELANLGIDEVRI